MRVYLERRRTFSCAHRYYNHHFDPAWNAERFGPLTAIHGHNYVVDATVAGELDPVSGIVVNLVEVKGWLRAAVEPFENNYVDAWTPIMDGRQPSTENIARILWDRLTPHMDGTRASLSAIRLAETAELWSEYRGEDGMIYVTRVYDFSAAHRLHSEAMSDDDNARVFGKCNRPGGHGHNYTVEVTVRGTADPETGFAYPLERLDALVEEHVLGPMDHRNLNTDVPAFRGVNPTSENLAVVIWDALRPGGGDALSVIKVRETPRNFFEYRGEGG
jgi:6-pyruvoyltetrahydropterin/6-carboxytetrahydropterin synthase